MYIYIYNQIYIYSYIRHHNQIKNFTVDVGEYSLYPKWKPQYTKTIVHRFGVYVHEVFFHVYMYMCVYVYITYTNMQSYIYICIYIYIYVYIYIYIYIHSRGEYHNKHRPWTNLHSRIDWVFSNYQKLWVVLKTKDDLEIFPFCRDSNSKPG